jgi:hypothetical protein
VQRLRTVLLRAHGTGPSEVLQLAPDAGGNIALRNKGSFLAGFCSNRALCWSIAVGLCEDRYRFTTLRPPNANEWTASCLSKSAYKGTFLVVPRIPGNCWATKRRLSAEKRANLRSQTDLECVAQLVRHCFPRPAAVLHRFLGRYHTKSAHAWRGLPRQTAGVVPRQQTSNEPRQYISHNAYYVMDEMRSDTASFRLLPGFSRDTCKNAP